MGRTNRGAPLVGLALTMLIAGLLPMTTTRPGRATEPEVMPGPFRRGAVEHPERSDENLKCEGCHVEDAREWRASQHARSDSDPVYRRALAIEPLAFCRGCHAPEVSPEAARAVSQIGVGCVTCHVTTTGSHGTLAATTPSAMRGPSPHPVIRSAVFSGDGACSSCHEFDFPTGPSGAHGPGMGARARMQSTVSEHAASPLHDVPCANCHMPWTGDGTTRHRDHRFIASGDPSVLRSAVTVHAERTTDESITITLETAAVGHAFPTGDLFRRVLVTAEAIDDEWAVHGEATQALHRRFRTITLASGALGRVPVGDDRVLPEAPRRVVLDLGVAAHGRAITWRVEYQRVEHPLDQERDLEAVVAESTLVASGTLNRNAPMAQKDRNR